MPRLVLVPVDGSHFAEHALPYALDIARRTGATIHLVLVHVPLQVVSPSYPYAEVMKARHSELQQNDASYMDALLERLEPSGVAIQPVLLRGQVASTLTRYVEDQEIDLVVMTTHGRGGFQRAWLGSTADSVMRHSRIPVLLVRPSELSREPQPQSERPIRTIVAALDGTEMGEMALRDACELGITGDATVVMVHVVQPPVAPASPYIPHTVQFNRDELKARSDHMRRYLQELTEADWLAGRESETRVLIEHQTAPAILEVADAVDADMIVVGTHGRGGISRLLLGSVADKVIRGTHRPVLVHRGTGSLARFINQGARPMMSEQADAHAHR